MINRKLRAAARKKKAQGDRQPGQASQTLRRRMGDALADLFDQFGPDIFSETTLALKEVILDTFKQGFEQLDSTIKEELGKRGIDESRQHIRSWANEIVEDVNHFGLDEVANALEDYVSTLSAEFQQEEQEGDELLDVSDEAPVEEVSEEDVEEVPAEDVPENPEDLNLEELDLNLPEETPPEQEAAAKLGPLGGRSQRARRRLQRRLALASQAPPMRRLRRK